MEHNFNCPKCGSEHTVRTPIELLSGVKLTFYCLLVISILGIAISPILTGLSVVAIVLGVIVNITRKIIHRNHWFMKCQRCKTEYYIVNPDKAHVIEKQRDKQAQKQERIAQYQRIKAEILARNGAVPEEETLLNEVDFFGYRKNALKMLPCKLRITDASYIVFDEKFTIYLKKEDVLGVRKKNYFLCVPTGVQVKVNDKHKRYNFVVRPKERDDILQMMTK